MHSEQPIQTFTIFHGFFSSFFSKEFYIDVATNWRWRSYLFLVMLTVIITFPGFSQLLRDLESSLDEALPKLTENLPTIEITDGKATVEGVEGPTEFVLGEDGNSALVLLIDLEATKESLKKTLKVSEDKSYIVLTRESLMVADPTGEIREMPLKEINADFTISKDNVGEISRFLFRSALFFGVPILLFFLFLYRLLLALIFALLADSMKAKSVVLPFSGSMSLGILAITPAIIISSILEYLKIQIPLAWLIYAVVSFCYLKFALSSLEERQKSNAI